MCWVGGQVKDASSGGVYYWNQATNETTAVGEPKPGPEGKFYRAS